MDEEQRIGLRKKDAIANLKEVRLIIMENMSISIGAVGRKGTYTNTWTIIDAIDEAIRAIDISSYKGSN